MKNKIENYKRMREDLLKQINLCNDYKSLIQTTLNNLEKQYKEGSLDRHTYHHKVNSFLKGRQPHHWYSMYDQHIEKCHKEISYCTEKLKEPLNFITKGKFSIGLIAILLSLAIIGLFFFKPTITGFVGYEKDSGLTFEDGYTLEGSRWMEIKGSRVYERCLRVNSGISFNKVEIESKITQAADNKDLSLTLYNHDEVNDEPSDKIKSCNVNDYDDLWKSCIIKDLSQDKGIYWICASASSGDKEKTYFTIGYQIGDNKKTALWTGDYWQKLERASYTVKARFIKDE